MVLYPRVPLLSNSRGGPRTRYAVNCAVIKARKKAGLDDNLAVAYAMRHQYITDALARGIPIALVADLNGTSAENRQGFLAHQREEELVARHGEPGSAWISQR